MHLHVRKLLILLLSLSATVSGSARDTTEHWFEVRTPHFTVLTDTNEKQALRLASQFERMRSVFHVLLPSSSDAPSPIVVLALKDRKAFQAVEPQSYMAKGQLDLAGLFLSGGDKNYILLRLDAQGEHPFATVYHEYTHFMTAKASAWMPLWLNEGMAEFYQNTDILEKNVELGQASPDDILYLRQNRLIPLPVLFKVDHASPYYHDEQKGSVFYAESWALTHYLIITDREKNTELLHNYLERLVANEDPVTAAQHAFGDLNQLQKALNNYVGQSSFKQFKMSTPATMDESSFKATPVPTAEADAVRADVLVDNDRGKEAQALLETTLRDDPNSALAHETMGYLKFREGDLAAAKKWYGEAVHLDSQSYLAHYYYASMSLQANDKDQDAEIESSLRSAIRLNPRFAPAYDTLAMFYGMRHKDLNEAHLLNLHAIELEPQNLGYRLNASSVLMQEEQFSPALNVMKAAQKLTKTPQETEMVQMRIHEIEQIETDVERNKAASQGSLAADAGAPRADTRTVTMTGGDGKRYVLRGATQTDAPRYPTEVPTSPHRFANGVLHRAKCFYPSILTLELEGSGKPLTFYRNDFYQIEFTAANFTPKGNINPCTDLEGLKGKVEYAEVSDKSVAGQILSIELSR